MPGTKTTKATEPKARADAAKTQAKKQPEGRKLLAVSAVIIIFVLLATAIIYTQLGSGPTSSPFSTFQKNFQAAPRVGMLVYYYNGTTFSYAIGCATSIIEQVVGSQQSHRNASTIDFYVANGITCNYASGLGAANQSASNETTTACLSSLSNEPSITISYNKTNQTTITPNRLTISGTELYLSKCGVSSAIG